MAELKFTNEDKEVGVIPINLDEDCVIVLRHKKEGDDFYFHTPPFKGTNLDFPPHIGTALTVCACLYYEDKDFHKLIGEKFEKYGAKYLEHIFGEEWRKQNENISKNTPSETKR